MPEYANMFSVSCTKDGFVHPTLQAAVMDAIASDFRYFALVHNFKEGAEPTLKEGPVTSVTIVKRHDGEDVDYDLIPPESWTTGVLPDGYYWSNLTWVKTVGWYYNTDF